ncbi:hypothetical protein [Yoonia litorea]|uniref:Uncharacterized protein n=1 Tax=Yoonia litorea TaxID=1123755 RepID=A0A1I6MD60_9RHOB|nr:hypothetical protein [Yoonia litorea]SFS13528.1 hypothetical protein SAMN05444714_1563 [Yoonia litorea]
MAEPDNALAAQAATITDAIDMSALQLLGVMQAHDGPAALLRSSRGQIARVLVGDEAFGIRITAIGDDRVTLTNRWGQSQALGLPQG